MEYKTTFLPFTVLSVFIHVLAFVLLGTLTTHSIQLIFPPANSNQSLQVSLDAYSYKEHANAGTNTGKVPRLHHKRPVSENLQGSSSIVEIAGHTKNADLIEPTQQHINTAAPTSSEEVIESLNAENRFQTSVESSSENLNMAHQQQLVTETKNSETRNTLILEKLNALVKENFVYPGFAIKRGWQGTVRLGLRIEANGTLSNVHIVKTSGHQILDQAALATLNATDHIYGIETWMAGNYFDTTLPVIYQLIDG